MKINRRAVRVLAVLGIAAAAGHLVQQRAEAPRLAVAQAVAAKAELPEPQHITPVSAGPEEPAAPLRAEGPKRIAPPVAAAPQPEPAPQPVLADACKVQFTLLPQPNAMIGVSVLAPCHPGERVVLRHAGLAVTEQITGAGSLFTVLPAMDAAGLVNLRFADGTSASDSLAVPELAGLRRFAVQWQDRDAFQLHGFEDGADYGDPGHAWAEAPQAPQPGVAATGGFLTLLGDANTRLPMLAQVYTFPAQGGEVVLEAAVTETTCGRELLGETLVSAAGSARVAELNVSMPDCEAKGDILVLRNLAGDMKIAAAN